MSDFMVKNKLKQCFFHRFAVVLGVFFCLFNPASAAELEVQVDGIEEIQGQLALAIYDTKEAFPSNYDKAVYRQVLKVSGPRMQLRIPDLAEGQYSISVYHDLNGNGELDRNFFGAPTELYGFSNNVRGFAGPPSYEATLITVRGNAASTAITVE